MEITMAEPKFKNREIKWKRENKCLELIGLNCFI